MSYKVNKHNGYFETSTKYKKKYIHLKRLIKELVLENGALCDQVSQMQDNLLVVNEEKRYLLKKLLEYQGGNQSQTFQYRTSVSPSTSFSDHHTPVKQKRMNNSNTRGNHLERHPNSRKPSRSAPKKPAEPLKPTFPIYLGTLTIHSIGDVTNEKLTYHSEDIIYPIGFISTRVFASMRDPQKKCVYTCKITDKGTLPQFEIIGDLDVDAPIVGNSPDFCHEVLLQKINNRLDMKKLHIIPNGAKFFGLSHPLVLKMNQNIFSQKQPNLKWIKREDTYDDESDPTIHFEAFLKYIQSPMFHGFTDIKEEII